MIATLPALVFAVMIAAQCAAVVAVRSLKRDDECVSPRPASPDLF
jgi:hypothetical protein